MNWRCSAEEFYMVKPLHVCMARLAVLWCVLPGKTAALGVDNKNIIGYTKLQIGYSGAFQAVQGGFTI